MEKKNHLHKDKWDPAMKLLGPPIITIIIRCHKKKTYKKSVLKQAGITFKTRASHKSNTRSLCLKAWDNVSGFWFHVPEWIHSDCFSFPNSSNRCLWSTYYVPGSWNERHIARRTCKGHICWAKSRGSGSEGMTLVAPRVQPTADPGRGGGDERTAGCSLVSKAGVGKPSAEGRMVCAAFQLCMPCRLADTALPLSRESRHRPYLKTHGAASQRNLATERAAGSQPAQPWSLFLPSWLHWTRRANGNL